MGAIELIEADSENANSFMEYLHSEPDLILNCQEIENFCNNLLPAEIEVPAEKETEGKGVDDKEEQCIGDVDIAMVSPDNVADVDKEADDQICVPSSNQTEVDSTSAANEELITEDHTETLDDKSDTAIEAQTDEAETAKNIDEMSTVENVSSTVDCQNSVQPETCDKTKDDMEQCHSI